MKIKYKIKIIAIDNLKTGISSRLSHLKKRKDILFIKHDVSKKLKINHKLDWIIHGASIASPIKYRKFPLETIEANVNGTRQMLDLAKRNNSKGIIIHIFEDLLNGPAHIKEAIKALKKLQGKLQ